MLAGEAASVSAFIDDTDEGLSGGASPKDLETMFQLIYLTFTEPRADPHLRQDDDADEGDAGQSAGQPRVGVPADAADALSQDHFRARPMTPEMVDQMNLQRSFAFYKDRFADASDFTFVFAGSFDLAAIKPLVEQYLGSLPSLNRRETWKNVGITPPGASSRRSSGRASSRRARPQSCSPGPSRSILRTRWRSRRWASSSKQAAREPARGVEGHLRRGGRGQRLEIPEPRYSVTIEFGCDPERTEELVATLLREMEPLKAEGPTDSEVGDAREALLVAQTDMAENSRLAEDHRALRGFAGREEFFNLPAEYQELGTSGSRRRPGGTSTRATTSGSRCSPRRRTARRKGPVRRASATRAACRGCRRRGWPLAGAR